MNGGDWKRRIRRFVSDTKWFMKNLTKRVAVLGALALLAFGVWFFATQPGMERLNAPHKARGVLIMAEDGQIAGSYGDIYGDTLQYDEFPQALVDAVVATEDRNFFHHFGIDPMGILRAMVANARAGHAVQGGSTITQQVAKNVFLTPERSLMRKLREAFLALSLEHRFSKQEILAMYLNRVYLGAGNFGVDAAAKRYFKKSARDLTLSESAILAGLLKAPSRFSPTSNPQLARHRAEQVLLNMADAGYLSPKKAEAAKSALAQTIAQSARNNATSSMYFTDWIMDQLPDYVGDVDQDLAVTTTFRLPLQKDAEMAIAGVMDEKGEKMHAEQAALICMTPDGAVRAMVGGRSYSKSPYNRAVQAHRQPGSSFKIFVYLAALENGFTPNTTVVDQPVEVPIPGGIWQPKNYGGDYKGPMPLSEAVAESINTVSVQVSQAVGLDNVIGMARRLGITSDLQPEPSIALGSNEVTLLELTNAYAHLAAGGTMVSPYGILKITSADGDVLYERQPVNAGQALNSSVVGMMNTLLEGVIEHGTGRAANIGRSAAGKTGTTSDYRDAWFMGYTPDLVTGVWVGNDDNSQMKKVTGGTLPAPIWRDFMKMALTGIPAHDLPTSSGYENAPLPWQHYSAPTPGAVTELPAPRPVAPNNIEDDEPDQAVAVPEKKEDFNLEPAFWHKLFNRNDHP